MEQHRHIDRICVGAAALAALLALLLMFGEPLGIPKASANPGYASRLFDDSRVHTVNIQIEDWGAFLAGAEEEAYAACTVEIDGETFRNVGIRAKGNNSLRLTEEYGLSRYSLKLEFDQFQDGGNYHGLDKLSLDASFQDNSYLKTYIAYDMMRFQGVPTPLCSYAWVTVNGEDWGLFLAVEEPEEDQPAGEEIGISTEDAFANYAGEPSVTVNVGFSPPCDRRRSSTTTSCREPRNPCRAAASWRGTRRV